MSKTQRRGGLGRGLGALIPTAPPAEEEVEATSTDSAPEPIAVMSGTSSVGGPTGGAPGSATATPVPGATVKVVNRVPSLASIAASSATDFYFDPAPVPGA